jgi:hypothetical protein
VVLLPLGVGLRVLYCLCVSEESGVSVEHSLGMNGIPLLTKYEWQQSIFQIRMATTKLSRTHLGVGD